MTNQAQVGHPKQHLVSESVEGFATLAELALDMRRSWNHATAEL
jgi:starch phosphorylase